MTQKGKDEIGRVNPVGAQQWERRRGMAGKKKADRDIEQGYTVTQTVAKLRRAADCLESGKPFRIQVAGERIVVPAGAAFTIEHEREGNTEEVEFQFKWKRE